jgi:hypothetical protein
MAKSQGNFTTAKRYAVLPLKREDKKRKEREKDIYIYIYNIRRERERERERERRARRTLGEIKEKVTKKY